MNTIILYKVITVDSNGLLQEFDFNTEADARAYAATISNPQIFRYEIIGSIERI